MSAKTRISDGVQMWYVRFWNENQNRYCLYRSTEIAVEGKKGRRPEADKKAKEMLAAIFPNSTQKMLIDYVRDFWREDSVYFRELEKFRGNKVSRLYIRTSCGTFKLYVETYNPFMNMKLCNLSTGMIREWMLYLSERGLSNLLINKCLQILRVPLAYAFQREELETNPMNRIKRPVYHPREKGILNKDEIPRLINVKQKKAVDKLSILLGLLCGMRAGEVRGLHYEDIENDIIHIRHNWQDMEGIKAPKYESLREVPLPYEIKKILDTLPQKNGMIFYNKTLGKPFSMSKFQRTFKNMLEEIGISKQEQVQRNITFHSLRHNFVTLGRLAGVSDFEMQTLAGHKSGAMMDHYSHGKQAINLEILGQKLGNNLSRQINHDLLFANV